MLPLENPTLEQESTSNQQKTESQMDIAKIYIDEDGNLHLMIYDDILQMLLEDSDKDKKKDKKEGFAWHMKNL